MLIRLKVLGFFLMLLTIPILVFSESIEDRFRGNEKLVYKVSFNGMPSGYIEWEYLGKQEVLGKSVEVVAVKSDTKILKLLNLTSKEKVFLDSNTYLPVKVERDVVLFGKKELIEEIYDQDQGCVKIIREGSEAREDILYQNTPIHNILELLYFFPQNIDFQDSEWVLFYLPNQKLKVKMIGERFLTVNREKTPSYFIIGRGAKRFSLWLDRASRLPLRLEFIFPLGKIVISKAE